MGLIEALFNGLFGFEFRCPEVDEHFDHFYIKRTSFSGFSVTFEFHLHDVLFKFGDDDLGDVFA